MPSILHKNDNVEFIARKNFTLNGVEYKTGEDVPEMNDHPKLEVFVRNGYVIPVVEDKDKLPFQFRHTAMTRDIAYLKLRLGNPKGSESNLRRAGVSETPQPVDDSGEEFDPKDHTVDEVLQYCRENPNEIADVYVLEEQGKNRSTLLSGLDEMLNTNEEEQDNG
jgi:hypothetical protein